MAAPQVGGFTSSTYSPIFTPARPDLAGIPTPPPRCQSAPDDRYPSGPVRYCHCNLRAERYRSQTEGPNLNKWILACPQLEPSARCAFYYRESDNDFCPVTTSIPVPIHIDSETQQSLDDSGRMPPQFNHSRPQVSSSASSFTEPGRSPAHNGVEAVPLPPAPSPPSRVHFDNPYESPPPPYEPSAEPRQQDLGDSDRHTSTAPPPQAHLVPQTQGPVAISEPPSAAGSVTYSDSDDDFEDPVVQPQDDIEMHTASAPPRPMPVIIEDSPGYVNMHPPHSHTHHEAPHPPFQASPFTNPAAGASMNASPPAPGIAGVYYDGRAYTAHQTAGSSGPAQFCSPPPVHKRKWEDYATAAVGHGPDPGIPDSHSVFTPHEMAAESSAAAVSRRRRESMNAATNGVPHHQMHPLHHAQTAHGGPAIPIGPQCVHCSHQPSVPHPHHHSTTSSHQSPSVFTPAPNDDSSDIPRPVEFSQSDFEALAVQVYETLYASVGNRHGPRCAEEPNNSCACCRPSVRSASNSPHPHSQNQPQLPFSFEYLKRALSPWAKQMQEVSHLQNIAFHSAKAGDAKILELQHRINTLEAEVDKERAISSKYKWERDVMDS